MDEDNKIGKKEETHIKELTIEDAREISKITTQYFMQQYPNLPFLSFRVHSIEKNTMPGFWVVICSFDEKFGSTKRIRYELHINKQGMVSELKELS